MLLLLDFKKAFDKIEWGFLFLALSRLGFSPKWIQWTRSLYYSASSTIKVNGEAGKAFQLPKLVRHGCPLAPYLFILVTNVLGHMLDDPKHGIECIKLPKGGCIRDQTFADDTTLYLKGTHGNMNKAQAVLDLFYQASGAKVNWDNNDHLGQQRWKGLGMGPRCWFEMGTKGGRSQISGHLDRISAACGSQFR